MQNYIILTTNLMSCLKHFVRKVKNHKHANKMIIHFETQFYFFCEVYFKTNMKNNYSRFIYLSCELYTKC